MNFKTTVVLIVLLFAAGLTLFFTRDRSGSTETASEIAKKAQKVFDVDEADLTKLAITSSADGKKLTLEKSNGKWRLTEPVNAPADSFSADALVRAVTGLESRGEVSGGTADAKSTGLDNPHYTIDLATKDGKSYTLLVGDKLPVGDNLYVSRKDKSERLVVSADLLEKLDKPAADYRDKKLVSDYSTAGVMQITINKPDGKIVIARNSAADDWKITEPGPVVPAERSDVESIVTTLTGLTASEYVSDDPTQAKMYQLDPPRMSAVLSSAPPSTQPATTQPATSQPAPIVVKFGRYDDVLKSNVFAMTSQSAAIAKVSASSLEAINKKPLDLRDRRAVDIDPAQVSSVRIIADVAATTKPTSKPASKADVHITRRKEAPVLVLAPTSKPSTQASSKPATSPATTQGATTEPATKPAVASTQPASKWEVFGAGSGATTQPTASEDSKIDTLLSSLHPLRVRKYLEKAPTTQPTATYVVTIVTQAAGGASPVSSEITLIDPGNGGDVSGTYNGLAFEVDRFFLDHLTGDFKKGAASASPSPAMNEGSPPINSFGP
jgi:Domain of unknown function (DUF4340)